MLQEVANGVLADKDGQVSLPRLQELSLWFGFGGETPGRALLSLSRLVVNRAWTQLAEVFKWSQELSVLAARGRAS